MKNDNLDFENGVIGNLTEETKIPEKEQPIIVVKEEDTTIKINTLVDNKDSIKDNSSKNLLFGFILLIIVVGFGVGGYFLFLSDNNIHLNHKNYTSQTVDTNDAACNGISLNDYLLYYDIEEKNLEYVSMEMKDGYKILQYKLSYNGYIFKNKTYVILMKGNKVQCGDEQNKTDKLLTKEELNINFNNLNSNDLKDYLSYEDKLTRYNKIESLYQLKDIFERMKLSESEKEKEIKYINDYYDYYVDSLNNLDELNYSKEALIKVIKGV